MQNQASLFEVSKEAINIADGQLDYYSNWLGDDEADALFVLLKEQVKWQQSTINLYGKTVKIPRLNAWYGDENCPYEYSGHKFQPKPWLPCLKEIQQRVERLTTFSANSVLVNCYRNGQDSVAWHSDDEPELGRNPTVISLSLGGEREFQLKHRYDKSLGVKKIKLSHGSLLVMSGELQHHWHHQVPKTAKNCAERINLTYRYVLPALAQ
ncbi:MAG: alpha-ketoglutarate-dependent dioxygenase AlkB family protein [Cellvibrionaceae bacterium]